AIAAANARSDCQFACLTWRRSCKTISLRRMFWKTSSTSVVGKVCTRMGASICRCFRSMEAIKAQAPDNGCPCRSIAVFLTRSGGRNDGVHAVSRALEPFAAIRSEREYDAAVARLNALVDEIGDTLEPRVTGRLKP